MSDKVSVKKFYIERMTYLVIDDNCGYFEVYPLVYGGTSEDGSDFKWGAKIFNEMYGEPFLELGPSSAEIHKGMKRIQERISAGEIKVYYKSLKGYQELISHEDFLYLMSESKQLVRDIDQFDLSHIGFNFTFKPEGKDALRYELTGNDEFNECRYNMGEKYRKTYVLDIEPINPATSSYKAIDKILDHERFNKKMVTQKTVFVIEYEEGYGTGYLYGFSKGRKGIDRYLSKYEYNKAAWFKDENEAIKVLMFLAEKFDISAGLKEIDTYDQEFPETPYFIEEPLY